MLEKNRKFREPHCHILKYTLYFLELMMKSKKNRVLGGFNGSYLRNTVGRAIAFLVSLKEAFSKKSLGNHILEYIQTSQLNIHRIFLTSRINL